MKRFSTYDHTIRKEVLSAIPKLQQRYSSKEAKTVMELLEQLWASDAPISLKVDMPGYEFVLSRDIPPTKAEWEAVDCIRRAWNLTSGTSSGHDYVTADKVLKSVSQGSLRAPYLRALQGQITEVERTQVGSGREE